MLSRVAESLMWMSRYLERANNLARIVEAIEELTLDHRHPLMCNEEAFWAPLFDVLDIQSEKPPFIQSGQEQAILRYFLLDRRNFSSVIASVDAARFNARGVRDQISNEIWEIINDLHLYCQQLADQKGDINVADFSSHVRFTMHCFRGLVESSIAQTEVWSFLKLGAHLERADQMSRLIDLKTFMLAKDRGSLELLEPYVWLIIMKASGTKTAGFGSAQPNWSRMESSLIFDILNPNSIRSSVRSANQVLHHLTGTRRGVFSTAAEKACGRLQSTLDYKSFIGLTDEDRHEYFDGIQQEVGDVFNQIRETYTFTSAPSSQQQQQSS